MQIQLVGIRWMGRVLKVNYEMQNTVGLLKLCGALFNFLLIKIRTKVFIGWNTSKASE